ncbi:MAG: T9SS C-terminal target domain-containing protein [Cytophagales bacterium]|nr:MAG: T9SS C-terminal target domain-containing protein [Cytophagales bacterium]TAF60158.1 MAG: T9SS C-terminal target domain-containing protein [Cytophagales bacterium]
MTLTKKRLLALMLCCFWAATASAQVFFNNLPHDGRARTLQTNRDAFDKWKEGKDLSKVKGWKRYKRWEWYNSTRTQEDGSAPAFRTYVDAISQAYEQKKQARGARLQANEWSPVGPTEFPTSPDPISGHGLGRINCVAFHPTDPNTFWIGASNGGVWKTTNNGESWTPLTDEMPMMRVSHIAVDPKNPDVIYLATGDYGYLSFGVVEIGRYSNFGLGIYKTTDGGKTWSQTGLSKKLLDFDGSLFCKVLIDPTNSNRIMAAGVSGVWHSEDAGDNWTKVENPDLKIVWDVKSDPVDAKILYATTGFIRNDRAGKANIYKSLDFGKTWEKLNSGIPEINAAQRIEVAIAPSDPNYVYALACGLDEGLWGVYQSKDAGKTWKQTLDTAGVNLLGWLNGSRELGDQGGQGTYDLALVVDAQDKNRIYTGGVNAWGSNDGGKTWDIVSFWIMAFGKSLHADQHFFTYNPINKTYYMCNDGGIYTTEKIEIGSIMRAAACVNLVTGEIRANCYELPTKWKNITGGLAITELYRIGLSRDKAGFIAGGAQDNGTYYNDGKKWISAFGGDGMEPMIHHSTPSTFYATNYSGALSRTTDGGKKWTSNLEKSMNDANEFGQWVTPYEMHPQNPSTLYTGFQNMWKSTDSGKKWKRISDFTNDAGIWDFELWQKNPDYIYVAKEFNPFRGKPSELWTTFNGGLSWIDVSAGLPVKKAYINYLAIDDSDSLHVWAVFGGYSEGNKVFETKDGGSTWENISSNLPNLPINTIAHQPQGEKDYVYVGTDVGVYYKAQEDKNWTFFSENLPNVIVSELHVHIASKKLYAATYGRGVWVADLLPDTTVIDTPTGFENYFLSTKLSVFPNPNKGQFTLEMSGLTVKDLNVEVVDITGRSLCQETLKNIASSHKQQFDLGHLKTGVYFMRISHAHSTRAVKFIIE